MKKMIYILPIAITVIFFWACSSDSDSRVKRISTSDFSDLKVYVGKPGGGEELTDLATAYSSSRHEVKDLDSLKQALGRRYFTPTYNQYGTYLNNITLEFLSDDLLSYIDRNAGGKQVISSYFFRNENGNDTLFINLKNGNPLFVAEGMSKDSLWRTSGFIKYPKTGVADWTLHQDTAAIVDIDKAVGLSYFGSLPAMTDPLDTIAICNLRYRYNK
ncbi:hypothetical protein [Dysgonomonas sp. 25]|uniref:hypothetical protein n=1 Tax=Dysgonomonas sp. 25 TaxID=2302933 RepID=UPI0013D3C030|nr:hypothetical protein [Dysgonomonas sp. 25]